MTSTNGWDRDVVKVDDGDGGVQGCGGENAGEKIVGHDAPTTREMFQPANRPRLPNIEQSKPTEAEHGCRPSHWGHCEDNRKCGDLIADDTAGIDQSATPTHSLSGGDTQKNSDDCDNQALVNRSRE